MKTVMPLPGDNQIVILHAFVRLRKTRYQSNDVRPRLEIISRASKFVALVHVDYVMPHKPQAHLLIDSIYATQDPKKVRGYTDGESTYG